MDTIIKTVSGASEIIDAIIEGTADMNDGIRAFLVLFFLEQLPESFNTTVARIRQNMGVSKQVITMDELSTELTTELRLQEMKGQQPASTSAASAHHLSTTMSANNNSNGKQGKPRTNTIKCRAHKSPEKGCWYCDPKPCLPCKGKGYSCAHYENAENCPSRVAKVNALHSQAVNVPHPKGSRGSLQGYLYDSGASDSITTDKSALENYQDARIVINCVSGTKVEAQGVGTIDGIRFLYCPEVQTNLIAAADLSDSRFTAAYDSSTNEFLFYDGDELKYQTVRDGKLYYIQGVPSINAINRSERQSLHQWHVTLGHVSVATIKTLAAKGIIAIKDESEESVKLVRECESCASGRHKRLPFRESLNPKATQVGQVIHYDAAGRVTPRGMDGSEYVFVFKDEYSGFITAFLSKTKKGAFEKFRDLNARIASLHHNTVQTVHCDGGEMISTEMLQYCSEKGIKVAKTTPHSPQSNGAAERTIGYVFEKTRTLLHDSKLPLSLWPFALLHAVHVINTITLSKEHQEHPATKWNKIQPSVHSENRFGAKCFVHIQSADRQHPKTSPRCHIGAYVGMSTTTAGYMVFVPTLHRVMTSRDVTFTSSMFFQEHQDGGLESLTIIDAHDQPTHAADEESDEDSDDQEEELEDIDAPHWHRSTITKENIIESPRRPVTVGHVSISEPPVHFSDVRHSPDEAQWKEAIKKELENMVRNGVLEEAELPTTRHAISSRWVFTLKQDAVGQVVQHKARLVAKGYQQIPGIDFDETFSPTASFAGLRIFLTMCAAQDLDMGQCDIKSAFLESDLEEELYLKSPEGFELPPGKVFRLRKALYGLKQSPRTWNAALDVYLRAEGFIPFDSDPCIYSRGKGADLFYLYVYVDDMLFGSTEANIRDFQTRLANRFTLSSTGAGTRFLNLNLIRNRTQRTILMQQSSHVRNLVEYCQMENVRPQKSPMKPTTRLTALTDRDKVMHNLPGTEVSYRSVVGKLMYLATKTRLDISFAVGCVSRFQEKPGQQHWSAVQGIVAYLKGTADHGILLGGNAQDALTLKGYADADWAEDQDSRQSTSGYVYLLGSSPISWRSKLQKLVSLSSCEAEVYSLTDASKECIWLRRLLSEFGIAQNDATWINEDNMSAIHLMSSDGFHQRTKHLDTRFKMVKQLIKNSVLRLMHCPTKDMAGDILTKPMHGPKHSYLKKLIGMN